MSFQSYLHVYAQSDQSSRIPDDATIVNRLLRDFPSTRAIYLFGSAVSRATTELTLQANAQHPEIGDLDIAIDRGTAIDGVARFETQLQLSVEWDIDVDLIDFASASTRGTLRHQILQHGRRLYAANPAVQDGYEVALISEHIDFMERRSAMDVEIFKRGRVYG
jgi:predicted nucleotidyltransferase